MLRQRQQIKLLQKISPQQIQFIKLLQVPTASLEARIKEEMEVNPALEDGRGMNEEEESNTSYEDSNDDYEGNDDRESTNDDDFNIDDYLMKERDDYRTRLPSSTDEDDDYEAPIVATETFYDRLQEQLQMLDLDDHSQGIAEHLIGSIDEDGYLRRPLQAMVNDLAFRYNIRATVEEVEEILKKIQKFDPPGIGARDLQECLSLQLGRKKETTNIVYAKKIIDEYFEEFSKKHFSKLKSALDLDEEDLKEVYDEITKLNPKPGDVGTPARNEFIMPDFILTVKEGEIDIKLNSRNAPDLKVSRSYLSMYEEYKSKQKAKKDSGTKETLDFVKSRIESAQWFIDAIRQRQYTLLNTMFAIAEKQQDFFVSGGDERKLKPMILKDIAEEVGMDISTISRVANSKYVETEFGIYALKYFFTEGITTEDGKEVSNREVKKILQELVDNEDKKKPLSDDKLSELLKAEGYVIARRTVAKYREQLNIPVARLRKEI